MDRKIRTITPIILIILLFSLNTIKAFASEKLTVGVAANFMPAFEEIIRAFKDSTAIDIEGVYASTGKLYVQIENGAPYDVFLSADEERAGLLFRHGLAERPFIYARGRVVLWTKNKTLCLSGDWRKALKTSVIKRVAIANPETAPYGAASVAALEKADLWQDINKYIVFGQTVMQVFQYAYTEAVDAGFCALSSVYSQQGAKGCYLPVDEAPDIIQSACILKRTKRRDEAERFVIFLRSEEASEIKKRYGYE